jgi:hypothetical protein
MPDQDRKVPDQDRKVPTNVQNKIVASTPTAKNQ